MSQGNSSVLSRSDVILDAMLCSSNDLISSKRPLALLSRVYVVPFFFLSQFYNFTVNSSLSLRHFRAAREASMVLCLF